MSLHPHQALEGLLPEPDSLLSSGPDVAGDAPRDVAGDVAADVAPGLPTGPAMPPASPPLQAVPAPPRWSTAPVVDEAPVWSSQTLLGRNGQAWIEHRGARYCLRRTAQGRLILTK